MATFTFTPDYGAQKDKQPRVRKITLGDGYSQRQASGLNTNPQRWNLRFSFREKTEADAIDDFLEARGAVEAFDWTPPGSTTSIRVVCEAWSVVTEKHNRYVITATFDQVFEP